MNGFDATRSIRALEKHRDPNTPSPIIVALTGLSGSNDEREALDAGIDLFLTKPVTFKNVSKILDQWSERSPQDD
jgi:CheY-like chemotaxis protein